MTLCPYKFHDIFGRRQSVCGLIQISTRMKWKADLEMWRNIMIILMLAFVSHTGAEIHGDKLYFRNQNLTVIPAVDLDGINLNRISKATYSHNNISVLKSADFDFFYQLPNLAYMYFDHNNISTIESDTFAHVPNLVHLDLSHNKLTEVSTQLFGELDKLKQLRHINLKRNPIRNYDNVERLSSIGIEIDIDAAEKHKRKKVSEFGGKKHAEKDHAVRHGDVWKKGEAQLGENVNQVIKSKDMEGGYSMYSDKQMEKSNYTFNKTIGGEQLTPMVTMKVSDADSGRDDLNTKFYVSIIFNCFAAFLVLVVLPAAMIIYFCVSKCKSSL